MVGIGCALEILKVAGDARVRRQIVIVIDVAIGASTRRNRMRTGQREIDGRVIERSRRPACSGMAGVASRCKVQGNVIGIGRALKILKVAADASRAVQRVIVVDVTIGTRTWWDCVHTGQLESGGVVVKRGVRPVGGVVTSLASLREVRARVIRIRGALEIFQVARDASCAAQRVVAIHVAIGALTGRNRVHAGKREARGGVVEFRVGPLHGVVTILASGREARVRHRTGGTGKVFLMARIAGHAAQVVIVIDVAVGALAGRDGVSTGQKESGRGVIEFGVQPCIGCVTGFAGDGELGRHVIGIRSSREIRLVAGVALRRHRLELAVGAALVTGVAVDGSMRSGEREPIIVLLNVFVRDLPSAHSVALFAIRTQLAAMNIGVAILAALPDVRKNHLHVALRAGDRSVHATKRIFGLIVIELGYGANGFPGARGVAVLTRHGQTSVRTMRPARGLRYGTVHVNEQRQNEQQHEFWFNPSAHELPLAFVLLPKWEKTLPKTSRFSALQFAVQQDYRLLEVSQKLRQSRSKGLF